MKIRRSIYMLLIIVFLCGCTKHDPPDNEEEYGEITISEDNKKKAEEQEAYMDMLQDMQDQMVGYTSDEIQDNQNISDITIENRDKIVDPSFLPVYINQTLAYEIQQYLQENGYYNVKHVYVIDDSVEKDVSHASFDLSLDGYTEILSVTYSDITETLQFTIVR